MLAYMIKCCNDLKIRLYIQVVQRVRRGRWCIMTDDHYIQSEECERHDNLNFFIISQ